MKSKIVFVSLLLIFVAQSSFAGLLYNYSQLALKDLDQVSKIIQEKLKESRKSRGDKVVPLKEAFQAVYSRPNEDGLIDKVVNPLKSALDEHDAYQDTVKSLTKEAIGALKNPKAFKAVTQVTYIVFLENIMAELKSKVTEPFEKSILTSIKDAKLEVSKEAQKERKLRVMKECFSPSLIATQILVPEIPAEQPAK